MTMTMTTMMEKTTEWSGEFGVESRFKLRPEAVTFHVDLTFHHALVQQILRSGINTVTHRSAVTYYTQTGIGQPQ